MGQCWFFFFVPATIMHCQAPSKSANFDGWQWAFLLTQLLEFTFPWQNRQGMTNLPETMSSQDFGKTYQDCGFFVLDLTFFPAPRRREAQDLTISVRSWWKSTTLISWSSCLWALRRATGCASAKSCEIYDLWWLSTCCWWPDWHVPLEQAWATQYENDCTCYPLVI
jgi:hypothetical protein